MQFIHSPFVCPDSSNEATKFPGLPRPLSHTTTLLESNPFHFQIYVLIFVTFIAEDDVFTVYSEVINLAGKWREMCCALKLRPGDESEIDSKYRADPKPCLRSVITKWIQGAYNVEMYGPPTWKLLIDAVQHRAGGDNPALAERITKRHRKGNNVRQEYNVHFVMTFDRLVLVPCPVSLLKH